MNPRALAAAERRLTSFLDGLVPLLGRAERRHWATLYVRGLLLDGERKSIEPMAARLPGADVQSLRQFVNQSPWECAPVEEALTDLVMDQLLPEAVLIIDETSFPKQGTHSVGVARQYCGALGKTANCQVAVSVHLGTDAGCVPLVWKLFLPDEWTDDPERCIAAGIPPTVVFRTKPELALDALDELLARGVGPRVVLADSAYGNSFEFRAALRTRSLPYCVQVEPTTKAWTAPPAPSIPPPYEGRGRPRVRPARGEIPVPQDLATLAQALPARAWRHVTWRPGSKGPLRSRFARFPVWLAHRWTTGHALPTDAVECLVEWPEDQPAPIKYWLADLRGELLGSGASSDSPRGAGASRSIIANSRTNSGSITSKAARGRGGTITSPSPRSPTPSSCLRRGAEKTSTMTLPQTRRWVQQMLLRLGEWCPWCQRPWQLDSS